MALNLTKAEIVEQIDSERRENNAKFISPAQTLRLLNRSIGPILLEPGLRTILELQTLTITSGSNSYALESDFKEVMSLWSGEGTSTGVKFDYKPVEEYNSTVNGYVYTFRVDGYIEIKCPDTDSLPSTTLKLRYWSTNIILDADGVTKKSVWVNDEDVCRLKNFDEYFIMWVTARILKRDGKKEWVDYLAQAKEAVGMLKEQPGSKTTRPRRSFGHYQFNP